MQYKFALVFVGFTLLLVTGRDPQLFGQAREEVHSADNTMQEDIDKIKTHVIDRLSEEGTWTVYGDKSDIPRLLFLVRSMRIAEAAPILAKRIDYQEVLWVPQPRHEAYSVVAVFESIGIPAIPHLLDSIQSPLDEIVPNELDRELRNNKQHFNSLALLALKRICLPLGDEDAIVEALIRTRMEEVDDTKRERLADALLLLEEERQR